MTELRLADGDVDPVFEQVGGETLPHALAVDVVYLERSELGCAQPRPLGDRQRRLALKARGCNSGRATPS